MLNETNYDITAWWNDQSFPGKDLFRISPEGALSFSGFQFLKERNNVVYFSLDTADVVLKNQMEKFQGLEAKFRDWEVEWLAAEDKLKLAEKVDHAREALLHFSGLGDVARLASLLHSWEEALVELTKETYEAKLKLAEQAEALADSEHFKEGAQAFRDIAEKWKNTGHLDRYRNDKLYNRIEAARKKFTERRRHFLEEEEKDMINNLDLKIEIVEKAEVLANSGEWKNTTEQYHKLMDEWKAVGKTPGKKNEELWQRLLAAKNTFFDRKKVHYNEVQHEHEVNYGLKEALIARAEAIKESTDWGNTTLAFTQLMEEWKKIGRVQQEKSDELWARFNAACDHFFEHKKAHFGNLRQTFDANYQLKKELLDRAHDLKNSTHFNDATAEFGELMDAWKKIGPVAREHSNAIWDEFNEARRFFFARKDADRDRRKQHQAARNHARIEDAKNKIVQITEDIREEEQKLLDFAAALDNISPGKKAGELKAHLENLIKESRHTLAQLKERQALANAPEKSEKGGEVQAS